jgi:hypothetical protein
MPSHLRIPRPVGVTPDLCSGHLPDTNWADAFEIETHRDLADMRSLAEQTIGSMPRWASRLLWVRNVLLPPFRMTPDGLNDAKSEAGHVDIFPVLEEKEDRIVLGLDDWHLDFRIIVERHKTAGTTRLRATTFVKLHNIFGRVYITFITPFHRLIVQSVLKNAL